MRTVQLAEDEHRAVEIMREIKRRTGFGDVVCTIARTDEGPKITNVKETYNHKLI